MNPLTISRRLRVEIHEKLAYGQGFFIQLQREGTDHKFFPFQIQKNSEENWFFDDILNDGKITMKYTIFVGPYEQKSDSFYEKKSYFISKYSQNTNSKNEEIHKYELQKGFIIRICFSF